MIDDPEIGSLRKKIDEIDCKLLELLSERLQVVHRIGEKKRQKGLSVFDPKREEVLLENLMKVAPASRDEEAIRAIFEAILRESRRLQEQDE